MWQAERLHKGTRGYHHNNNSPIAVANLLQPLFDILSEPEMLKSGIGVVYTLFAYLMVELFPVTHYFIIISCMHDYSPFISVLTPAAQPPFVPL